MHLGTYSVSKVFAGLMLGRSRFWLSATLIFCPLAVDPLDAAEHPVRDPPAVQRVAIPGTDFDIIVGPIDRRLPAATHPDAALVHAIGNWLSTNFDLPRMTSPPWIEFRSPAAMVAMRYGRIDSNDWSTAPIEREQSLAPENGTEIVALYADEARTIYLTEGWSGDTPAELSVLVHEMVHHLQNLAGLKYECAEAREKQAFAAQDRWLALFGTNLEAAFAIDPFTLLVRTSCFY